MSRICKGINDDVAVLRNRRLDHLPFVYVWLDATYVHVREAGQVVSTTESANVKIKSIRRVRVAAAKALAYGLGKPLAERARDMVGRHGLLIARPRSRRRARVERDDRGHLLAA